MLSWRRSRNGSFRNSAPSLRHELALRPAAAGARDIQQGPVQSIQCTVTDNAEGHGDLWLVRRLHLHVGRHLGLDEVTLSQRDVPVGSSESLYHRVVGRILDLCRAPALAAEDDLDLCHHAASDDHGALCRGDIVQGRPATGYATKRLAIAAAGNEGTIPPPVRPVAVARRSCHRLQPCRPNHSSAKRVISARHASVSTRGSDMDRSSNLFAHLHSRAGKQHLPQNLAAAALRGPEGRYQLRRNASARLYRRAVRHRHGRLAPPNFGWI